MGRGEVEPAIENIGKVLKPMTEDVIREAGDELVISSDAKKQIGKATALMFKELVTRIPR